MIKISFSFQKIFHLPFWESASIGPNGLFLRRSAPFFFWPFSPLFLSWQLLLAPGSCPPQPDRLARLHHDVAARTSKAPCHSNNSHLSGDGDGDGYESGSRYRPLPRPVLSLSLQQRPTAVTVAAGVVPPLSARAACAICVCRKQAAALQEGSSVSDFCAHTHYLSNQVCETDLPVYVNRCPGGRAVALKCLRSVPSFSASQRVAPWPDTVLSR